MSLEIAISIVMTLVIAATPILLAGLGELVAEKSGVLNLGVEGMMLVGAVAGFITASLTGFTPAGYAVAALAGLCASLLFGVLALTIGANQVATGLALTIFGTGLSSLAGAGFVGTTITRLPALFPQGLAGHPIFRIVFGYDVIVYLSVALTLAAAWFLNHTRPGLILRCVGESDASAHAIGYPVTVIRYLAVAFGGALAGLAGAYYSLAVTPMWADRITAGRGWIALALVVFSSWRPWRLLLGAYIFGAVMTLELYSKAAGFALLPPEMLAMLPYLATVVALAVIAMRPSRGRLDAPRCLGKTFRAGA
ncbi:MAG: ABC transporter permease [Hyphomicrobiales bacterium]|nr:ABC transporter permease [Hyphomicrobiales bacterium]MBV9113223.1 ABC transporter permease [Hyphomicrobiales bacterium]MBV9518236.1 ABC transporter permease [Hyphomicrobiales bacterium]